MNNVESIGKLLDTRANINVNEATKVTKNNVNVQNTALKNNVKRGFAKSQDAERVARMLVEKLDDEGSFKFFCKIAHKLPESVIWQAYEQAQGARSPKRLFTWLCNKELSNG